MSKRGPSVLVTDARERQAGARGHRRSDTISGVGAATGSSSASASTSERYGSMRHISVDNILQNNTEIPSGQPRGPPAGPLRLIPTSALSAAAAARRGLTRRSSYSAAGVSNGAGQLRSGTGATAFGAENAAGVMPVMSRTGLINAPSRTSKVSEKLVLLPETVDEKIEDDDEDDEAAWAEAVAGENAEAARRALNRAREEQGSSLYDGDRPPRDEELDVLRKRGGIRGKSYAERLPKGQRTEKVARLTAYCTAQGFKMRETAKFLRTHHDAKTKLYDDCLYTVYHLPLLPRTDRLHIRSRPILKTPGTGKTVLDLEIERSEQRDEHMGYYDDLQREQGMGPHGETIVERIHRKSPKHDDETSANGDGDSASHANDTNGDNEEEAIPERQIINRLAPDVKNFAEMFVFSYGVVVFWNFSETQERNIISDLTFAENIQGVNGGVPLAIRPLPDTDFETEEFHFEYSDSVKRPRVFNDMITLLPRSDHMVKLTISHAIAQSTKLCYFEENMSQTMISAQHVPKQLALTGELNMSRTEILKMLGRLFKSRVDINLSSNILDVPNFFWDAEPTLHPLYEAIREYLEIEHRTQVLNERCRVFLDLAEILADSVADSKMSNITWIVIILIVISIAITVTEVSIRFSILTKEKKRNAINTNTTAFADLSDTVHMSSAAVSAAQPPWLDLLADDTRIPQKLTDENGRVFTLDELEDLIRAKERQRLVGGDVIGKTFAGI